MGSSSGPMKASLTRMKAISSSSTRSGAAKRMQTVWPRSGVVNHRAPVAVLIRAGSRRTVDGLPEVMRGMAFPRAVAEEGAHVVFDILPGVGAIEAFVTDARAAFADVGGEGGFGKQQELPAELAEDVVVGVDDEEIGDVGAMGIGLERAGLQAFGNVAEAIAEFAGPIGDTGDRAPCQVLRIEPEIKEEKLVVGEQDTGRGRDTGVEQGMGEAGLRCGARRRTSADCSGGENGRWADRW